MLSINENEIETNDTTIFELMADYMTLSGYMYRKLVDEFGEIKAKDFMEHQIVKWVSKVEKE